MAHKMFGWEMDKNVEDFAQVSKNMREEGHQSRADVIDYLIARVKISECKLARINSSLTSANENIENLKRSNQVKQDRIREIINDQPDSGWH